MDEFWSIAARLERAYYRAHNVTGRVTLKLPDDTNPIQKHQIEGYDTELRDGMQRFQTFGFASVPVPGTKGVALCQSGHRGFITVVGDEHPEYRPKNQQPGEALNYMVDGAQKDGTGGTMRPLLKGALGWNVSLTGTTINVGDSHAVTINVGTNATNVTINMGSSTATVNITGSAGDVVIAGISLRHHTHSDPQGGNTGQSQ